MAPKSKKQDTRKGAQTRNFIDSVLGKNGARQLTADKFLQIWKYYDKDGNRYLEDKELDHFLEDLVNSSLVELNQGTFNLEELQSLKRILLQEFDQNHDGKISCRELSSVLSETEAFFLLFRLDNSTEYESGIDYMRIWKKYDRDLSGFIEINELKEFLRDLITRVKQGVAPDENRLNSYTEQIMGMFDANSDGKLSLSEMAKMLPAEQNFVQQVVDKALNMDRLTETDLKTLMDRYDRNGDGYLVGTEITNLVKDILAASETNGYYTASDVYELEKSLMKGCDVNQDGRIDRKELNVILVSTIYAITQEKADNPGETDLNNRLYQGRKNQHILSYVPLPSHQS